MGWNIRSLTLQILIIAIFASACIGLFALVRQSDITRQAEIHVSNLAELANRMSLLEWQAIAKLSPDPELLKKVGETRKEYEKTVNTFTSLAKGFDGLPQVITAWNTYNSALDHEFKLLATGKIEQAKEFDEKHVDPAFETYVRALDNLRDDFQKHGGLVRTSSFWMATALIFGSGLLIGLLMAESRRAVVAMEVLQAEQRMHKSLEDGLKQANDNLEQQVTDRTEELIRINVDLRAEITERTQIEIKLRSSEERFKVLFDRASDGIMIMTPDGKLVAANESYASMHGYSVDEILAINLHELDSPKTRHLIGERMRRVLSGENAVFEVEHFHKAGHVFPLEVSASMVASDGEILIQSFHRDISERRKTEKLLDERKRLLDTLLANLPVGVFMVEATSGKPLVANDKAMELLGRGILPETNKENLTEVYEAYKFGTNERYPIEEMPIVRGMYGESTTVDDLLVIRPDGTSKLLEISGTPVLNAENHPWASIVCFQDITNRKEHENEQLKMQKLESLGVLAGGIAHDFNNILTGIMGNISFAKMFIDESHKSFNVLEGAEKASVRATELARQLLTFSKGGEPVKKIASVVNILNESISLVLRGSNVKSTINIPNAIYPIEADEGQISQVFHNILINATQAMPGGGVVTISAHNKELEANNSLALSPGLYVCISFADEGCGIALADLNKIFDPYFTTKASGNGLGLASCRSIIIKHGGHIGVTSRVGKGTMFTIHVPSIGESAAACPVGFDAQRPEDHVGGAILVMDDEEMIRDIAAAMLEEVGYQVTTCGDGVAAIRHYADARESGTPFLAVIMDLTIPGGMGGKEAAREILAIDPTACLVVSSGYSNDPIISDFSSYGFTGAIAKPYQVSELEQLIRSLLNN